MARPPKPWWHRESGEYRVMIRGQRHHLGADKDEAERKFHELMAQPQEKPVRADSVVALIDEFLEWTERNRDVKTYAWYRKHLQSFATYLSKNGLKAVTTYSIRGFHVQKWLDEMTCGNSYKNGAARAIARCFNWAVKQGYLNANPIRGVEKPKAERRENIITPAEYISLLALIKDVDFRDLVTVAWETGARPQEMTGMEARHIEVRNQRAVIPMKEAKGKKRIRVVYFTDNALAIVTRRMEQYPEGALFRNTRGRRWTAFSVDCRFKRLVEKFGRKIALYDLRHSFSTRLLEAGVDPLTVSILLGHVDTTVLTKVYAHTAQNAEHLLKALKS